MIVAKSRVLSITRLDDEFSQVTLLCLVTDDENTLAGVLTFNHGFAYDKSFEKGQVVKITIEPDA